MKRVIESPTDTPDTIWNLPITSRDDWQAVFQRHLSQWTPGFRAKATQVLNGRWVHKEVTTITGNLLIDPRGKVLQLAYKNNDSIGIRGQGKMHTGRLARRHIRWDDGDIWVREPHLPPFEGDWAPKNNLGLTIAIFGKTALLHTNEVLPITAKSHNHITVAKKGRPCTAKLVGGERLDWDDGTIWLRTDDRKQPLDGRWTSKHRPSTCKLFRGNTLYRSDGVEIRVDLPDESKVVVTYKGKVLSAELQGNELVWEDGDIWVRFQGRVLFDGRWSRKEDPEIAEIIDGDTIYRARGAEIKLEPQGNNEYAMHVQGRRHIAQLLEGHLVWDDGDIWMREEEARERQQNNEEEDQWWAHETDTLPLRNQQSDLDQLVQTLGEKWYITGLLFVIPLGFAAFLSGIAGSLAFPLSFVAMAPLAWLIGSLAHDLSASFASDLGTLFASTFFSVLELVLCFVGVRQGHVRLVQCMLVGLVLAKLLLGAGLLLIFADGFKAIHTFHQELVRTQGSLLLLASACVALPTVQAQLSSEGSEAVVDVSRGLAFLLISLYVQYIVFQHGKQFHAAAEQGDRFGGLGLSRYAALVALLFCTGLAFGCAEVLFRTLEEASASWWVSEEFVCVVGLPLLGTLTHFKLILEARKSRLELSLTSAVGSALHTILLVLPLAVLTGSVAGVDMTLDVRPFLGSALLMAAILVSQVLEGGTSHWLQGAALTCAHICFALCYVHGNLT